MSGPDWGAGTAMQCDDDRLSSADMCAKEEDY
jgi:hypothetical protein